MKNLKDKLNSAWAWIPSLYLIQGLPNVAVVALSVIMYRRMGISNTEIALYTGMRLGEICALKWSDIDLEEGLLYVRATAQRINNYDDEDTKTELYFGSPKTVSSERLIALSPKTVLFLKAHKENADCEYVISCKGHIAEPRVCQYRFDVLLEKAEIEKINFHSLRHTFATRCLEQGVDVKTLSQLLGHARVEMTLKYGDSLTEHKKKAVTLLDAVHLIAI